MKTSYSIKGVIGGILFSIVSMNLIAADQTVSVGGDIQTAIDNVAASGGGTVTLAAGTHLITEPVRMKSNVTLQGTDSWASTLQTTTHIQMIIADAEGLANLTIQNLDIVGINSDVGGGIQITSQGVEHTNIQLLNVHCRNTGWGVHLKGVYGVIVEDCLFENNGAAGKEYYAHNMYLRRVYGAVVRDSRFMNSISSNGINISYSEDIEIYDCEISGNYFRGVRAANTDGYLVHDCIINDNGHGSDRGGVGLLANSEGVPTTNVDFRRNCVSNNASEGVSGVNGVTGVTYDNNSYGNGTNYSLPNSVSQLGNITNSSIDCVYGQDPSVSLSAVSGDGSVALNWTLGNIRLGDQDIFRDTDSDPSGRTMIAANVSGSTYTDNTVTNGTTYWYWVKATDISAVSTNSDAVSAIPTSSTLPSAWSTTDIGAVGAVGSAGYSGGIFNLEGSGADIWGTADEFRYVYQNVSGDVTITARVVSIENTNSWAKAGVMVRESLGAGSTHASSVVASTSGVSFQRRTSTDGLSAHTTTSGFSDPYWVRIERSGDTFLSFYSANGSSWVSQGSVTISMNTSVYVGLVTSSHTDGILCATSFDNVSVDFGSTINNFTIQESASGFCSVDGTVDSNNAGFTGAGFANTTNALYNGVNWEINGSAGDYTFEWEYASTSSRPADLIVNGTIVSSSIGFNPTGSWSTWTTTNSVTVSLAAGVKTIRLEAMSSSGLANIDYMEVTGPDAVISNCTSSARIVNQSVGSLEEGSSIGIYPNPVLSKLKITTQESLYNQFTIFNLEGKAVLQDQIASDVTELSIDMSILKRGVYMLRLSGDQSRKMHKLIKQ